MSARIFVLSGKALGSDFTLNQATVMGRGKDAGVRLSDPSVSRLHAKIEPEGDGWRVTDLDSSNGIWVGGEQVKTALLKDLDEFRVGALELRIRIGGDVPPVASVPLSAVPAPDVAEPQVPEPEIFAPDPPAIEVPDVSSPEEPEEIELELEGDWSEPEPEPAPAPVFTPDSPRVVPTPASAPAHNPARPILQHAAPNRSGNLFSGDLGQQPFFVRWALYLLAIAFFVGLVWGISYMVSGVRQARSGTTVEAFK
jgi:hypothetical protein